MGRTPREHEPDRIVSLRLPAPLWHAVVQIAREEITPPSVLVRRWINERVNAERRKGEANGHTC